MNGQWRSGGGRTSDEAAPTDAWDSSLASVWVGPRATLAHIGGSGTSAWPERRDPRLTQDGKAEVTVLNQKIVVSPVSILALAMPPKQRLGREVEDRAGKGVPSPLDLRSADTRDWPSSSRITCVYVETVICDECPSRWRKVVQAQVWALP
jgi:hypothetical protein